MLISRIRCIAGYICLGIGVPILIVPFFPSTAMIAAGILLLGFDNGLVKRIRKILPVSERDNHNVAQFI
jgi:F0F1-type ATP synthase assembly protein I